MLYIFKFPDIGEGVTEGKILEWFVKKGQKISEGDPVVKMETDKVVADIPSPRSGVIKNIFGKVGDTINVDDALVEIEIAGDEAGDEMEIKKKEVPVEEQGYGVKVMVLSAISRMPRPMPSCPQPAKVWKIMPIRLRQP